MIAHYLPLNDAEYNLAVEETLFRSLIPGHPGYFLLWQNKPSVIVGRHQNTAGEVSAAFLRERGINAVRRVTGGGAVYHDAGNLNYSFLLPSKGGAQSLAPVNGPELLAPLLAALRVLDVPAECSGRNDILAGGKKISGTAQCRTAAGSLFHGAMLVSVDLSVLEQALTGDPEKYRSKALPSIRSRVCNVADLLPERMRKNAVDRVAKAALAAYGAAPQPLDPALALAAKELEMSKYRSWDWNYGASPEFTERRKRRFAWGGVECCFVVRGGVIQSCRIYGDFFAMRDIAELEEKLTGLSRRPEAILAMLQEMPLEAYFSDCDEAELRAFIASGGCDA